MQDEPPSFRNALRVWCKIGLLSFGGPAGQIALMQHELVDKRRWLDERSFLHALNYCMLLPGPEAQQLAIYTGWRIHGVRGGLAAGALFVLPGALLMALVSFAYMTVGRLPWVEAVFYGLKAAVLALVAAALLRLSRKVLHSWFLWVVAAASFVAIYLLGVAFPWIVATALGIGFLVAKRSDTATPVETRTRIPRPTVSGTLGRIVMWAGAWLAPPLACFLALGADHVLSRAGMLFSKTALVTFGGAYAVLPYVAEQAVEVERWMSTAQMMDGLGLAETTPGPLVLVLQFVGFVAGWQNPDGLPPALAALLVAAMASWCVFVPGFLFIFAGAPWIERFQSMPRWSRALEFVSAAMAGVILNLAVVFARHTVIDGPRGFDPLALGLAVLLFGAMVSGRLGMLPAVGIAALAGLGAHAAGWL